MDKVVKAINQLGDALTDRHSCICIVDGDDNEGGAMVLCNGDADDLANMLGASILSGLTSNDEQYNMTGNQLFDAVENALVGLMAYNDNIYERVIHHIQSIPGKPLMVAKLNRE